MDVPGGNARDGVCEESDGSSLDCVSCQQRILERDRMRIMGLDVEQGTCLEEAQTAVQPSIGSM